MVRRGLYRPFRGRLSIDELSRVLDGQRSFSDGEIVWDVGLGPAAKVAGSPRLPAENDS